MFRNTVLAIITLTILFLAGCSKDRDNCVGVQSLDGPGVLGLRGTCESDLPQGNGNESDTLSCNAVPIQNSIQSGQSLNIQVNAFGGTGNYSIPGDGIPSFGGQTTIVRTYTSTRANEVISDSVTITDSGRSATCSFTVNISPSSTITCNISTASSSDPRLGESVTYNATFSGGQIPYDTQFDPAVGELAPISRSVNASSDSYAITYDKRGQKNVRLQVTDARGISTTCTPPNGTILVRDPRIQVAASPSRSVEFGEVISLDISAVNPGDFLGSTINYTVSTTSAGVTFDPTSTSSVDVSSSTTVFQQVDVLVEGTSGGETISTEISLFFTPPAIACRIEAISGAFIGDEVEIRVTAENGKTLRIDAFDPGLDGTLIGGLRNPLRARWSSTGVKVMSIQAFSVDDNEPCNYGNASESTIRISGPVACSIMTAPNPSASNDPFTARISIPTDAGVGPFRLLGIGSLSNAGMSADPAGARQLDQRNFEWRASIFEVGTFPVTATIVDDGAPAGSPREQTCTTIHRTFLGRPGCYAEYYLGGRKVFEARPRDSLRLRIDINHDELDERRKLGGHIAIHTQGDMLSAPPNGVVPSFPVFGNKIEFSERNPPGVTNTSVTVTDPLNRISNCAAPLSLTPPLECEILEGNREFVSLIRTIRRGMRNTDSGSVATVDLEARVRNEVAPMIYSLDDGNRNFSITQPIFQTSATLTGRYDGYGKHFAKFTITDNHDKKGATCQAEVDVEHNVDTYLSGPFGEKTKKCWVKLTNTAPTPQAVRLQGSSYRSATGLTDQRTLILGRTQTLVSEKFKSGGKKECRILMNLHPNLARIPNTIEAEYCVSFEPNTIGSSTRREELFEDCHKITNL